MLKAVHRECGWGSGTGAPCVQAGQQGEPAEGDQRQKSTGGWQAQHHGGRAGREAVCREHHGEQTMTAKATEEASWGLVGARGPESPELRGRGGTGSSGGRGGAGSSGGRRGAGSSGGRGGAGSSGRRTRTWGPRLEGQERGHQELDTKPWGRVPASPQPLLPLAQPPVFPRAPHSPAHPHAPFVPI